MEPFVQMMIMIACFGVMYASVMIPAYLGGIMTDLDNIYRKLDDAFPNERQKAVRTQQDA